MIKLEKPTFNGIQFVIGKFPIYSQHIIKKNKYGLIIIFANGISINMQNESIFYSFDSIVKINSLKGLVRRF
jgi:hypothetical protein